MRRICNHRVLLETYLSRKWPELPTVPGGRDEWLSRNQTKLRVGEDLIIIGRLLLLRSYSQSVLPAGCGPCRETGPQPFFAFLSRTPFFPLLLDLSIVCGSILSCNTGVPPAGCTCTMYMHFALCVIFFVWCDVCEGEVETEVKTRLDSLWEREFNSAININNVFSILLLTCTSTCR